MIDPGSHVLANRLSRSVVLGCAGELKNVASTNGFTNPQAPLHRGLYRLASVETRRSNTYDSKYMSEKANQIGNWQGPRGWSGSALPQAGKFEFAALPWSSLDKEGDRQGDIECVKASRSRRVYRLEMDGNEPGSTNTVVFAKRYLMNTVRRKMASRIQGTKAAREFDLGHRLRELGIPTPLPLAHAVHWRAWRGNDESPDDSNLQPASYLLTQEWENEGSVKAWLKEHEARRPEMVDYLAAFLAKVHEAGFYHDDCSCEHLLVRPGADLAAPVDISDRAADLAFIDLDNGNIHSRPIPLNLRIINLFQVVRSVDFELFSGQARGDFIARYLEVSGLKSSISTAECWNQVEKVAKRKVGRSVLKKSGSIDR